MEALKFGNEMLKALGMSGWTTKSVKSMTAIGYSKETLGFACPMTKTVGLNAKLLASGCEATVTDTVLHEIAHAICDTVHGTHLPAHGRHWKKIAKTLGAVPKPSGNECECCDTMEIVA